MNSLWFCQRRSKEGWGKERPAGEERWVVTAHIYPRSLSIRKVPVPFFFIIFSFLFLLFIHSSSRCIQGMKNHQESWSLGYVSSRLLQQFRESRRFSLMLDHGEWCETWNMMHRASGFLFWVSWKRLWGISGLLSGPSPLWFFEEGSGNFTEQF